MTIRFIEGFELYGGSSTVPDAMRTKWGTVDDEFSCKPNETGRFFGYSCEMGFKYSEGEHDELISPAFDPENLWVVSFAFNRVTPSPSYPSHGDVLKIRSGSTVIARLERAAASWKLMNGVGSTLHEWTGATTEHDVWEFIELKIDVLGSGPSTAELRIDGVGYVRVIAVDWQGLRVIQPAP